MFNSFEFSLHWNKHHNFMYSFHYFLGTWTKKKKNNISIDFTLEKNWVQAENPVEKIGSNFISLFERNFFYVWALEKKCMYFIALEKKRKNKNPFIRTLKCHTLEKKYIHFAALEKNFKKKWTQILDSIWNPRRKLGNYMSCCRCCWCWL